MKIDEFKTQLYDLLFAATKTEELSVERLFEVVDEIATEVYNIAMQKAKP